MYVESSQAPVRNDMFAAPVSVHRRQEDGGEREDEQDVHLRDRSVRRRQLLARHLQLLQAGQRPFHRPVGSGYHVRTVGSVQVLPSEVVLLHGGRFVCVRALPDQLSECERAGGERFQAIESCRYAVQPGC